MGQLKKMRTIEIKRRPSLRLTKKPIRNTLIIRWVFNFLVAEAGDGTRNYFKVFLQFGVAFVGPGDPGPAGESKTTEYYQDNPNVKNWGVELQKVNVGDWVAARSGKHKILGVGKVVGSYEYSNLFEDVEGWDLQHFIRVTWYLPLNNYKRISSDSTLRWNTLSVYKSRELIDKINQTEFSESNQSFSGEWELPELLESHQINSALINDGIRIQDAENISNTINRIIQLTDWYWKNDFKVLEQELKALLVIPFLISLGWSEQKIKLEYDRIDLALFKYSFTNKDYGKSPHLILEAKNFNNGLAFTTAQIEKYGIKYPDCHKFLITNGFRYRYFEKHEGKLIERGYFNLLRLRKRYALGQKNKTYLSTLETLLSISNF